jgi:Ser/Thr protein kinase RdoA (MazF antagonist)
VRVVADLHGEITRAGRQLDIRPEDLRQQQYPHPDVQGMTRRAHNWPICARAAMLAEPTLRRTKSAIWPL